MRLVILLLPDDIPLPPETIAHCWRHYDPSDDPDAVQAMYLGMLAAVRPEGAQ